MGCILNEYAEAFQLLDEITTNRATAYNILEMQFSNDINRQKLKLALSTYTTHYQPALANNSRLFSYKLKKIESGKVNLLIKFHQSISDASTVRMFIKLLAELYNGKIINNQEINESFNESIEINYNFESDFTYWKTLLNKKPIEVKFAKQATTKEDIHSIYFSSPLEQSNDIRRFCHLNKTTPFILFSTLFGIIVNHYTSQKEFCLLYPVDMRPAGKKQLLGCYINSVLIAFEFKPETLFIDFLKEVQNQRKTTKIHQQSPYHKLLKHLREQKIIDSADNANIMIAESLLSDSPEVQFKNVACHYKWVPNAINGSMVLIFDTSTPSIRFRLDIKNDLPDFFQQQFAQHFFHLLDLLMHNPEKKLCTISLLNQNACQKIIHKWNDTRSDLKQIAVVHEAVQHQANQNPQQLAVIDQYEKLTYEMLNRKANALANQIISLTNQSQPLIIGICAERSTELVIGILAILKAGGAYLPIEPKWSVEKIKDIMQDAKPCLVLAQTKFIHQFQNVKTLNISVGFGESDTIDTCMNIFTEQLAYIMYTSGSTGKPKGIMVQHDNLRNHLNWIQNTYQLSQHDRVLFKTPFTFDVSVWEILWPLSCGASLFIAPPGKHQSPNDLLEIIENNKINTLHFVGSMAQAFIDSVARKHHTIISVKNLFLGGEYISSALKEKCQKVFKNAQLSVFYGPTETTIESTSAIIDKYNIKTNGHIGRPISNTSCYILDEYLNPVPIGVIGELYIGGMGVARGYLNRPELTAERFIANPFVTEAEQAAGYNTRLYKTGDLVRWLEDGNIEYIGRKDFQIKLRGQRIELGEIEACLSQYPDISQVAVAVKGQQSDQYLVAYYTSSKIDVNPENLREHLSKTLPEYMVPEIYVWLREMPLSNNGKLDRKALPDVDFGAKVNDVPPSTSTEIQLAIVWQKVLKIEISSRNTSFFALGGHSLAAIKLIHEINKVFHSNYAASFIFEHKTITEQARILEQQPQKRYQAILPLTRIEPGQSNLFLIHPGLAGTEVYEHLVSAFPQNMNIYGIDSYNLYHTHRPIKNIRKLAARYVKELKKHQAKGPYELAGWSLGGVIAYEMALQLRADGETVDKLYLIDSFMLADIEKPLLQAYCKTVAHNLQQEYTAKDIPSAEIQKRLKLMQLEYQMMHNQDPVVYDGDVILWNAISNSSETNEVWQTLKANANGWKSYLSKLTEIKVDTDHYNIIKDPKAITMISELFTKNRTTSSTLT